MEEKRREENAASKRITSKENLKDWITYEQLRFSLRDLGFSERGVIKKFQRTLRKVEYYKNTGKKLRYIIGALRLRRMQNLYGLRIGPNTCGRGLKIMHLGSILLNGVVGENCSLHINTALVAKGTSNARPELGDNVVVGVGAVIVGGVKVADGVAIGAGAVVTKNIDEPDIAVAGCPAKKVSNNGRNEWRKANERM